MLNAQQITKKFKELSEVEAKALLVDIFTARNYGNQEMIQTMNDIVERLQITEK